MRFKSSFCFFLILALLLRASVASAVGLTLELGNHPKLKLGGPELQMPTQAADAFIAAPPMVVSKKAMTVKEPGQRTGVGVGQGGGEGALKTTAIIVGVTALALVGALLVAVMVAYGNADE